MCKASQKEHTAVSHVGWRHQFLDVKLWPKRMVGTTTDHYYCAVLQVISDYSTVPKVFQDGVLKITGAENCYRPFLTPD